MNNYEKITAIIKSGHLAHCVDERGDNVLFSTITNDYEIRRSIIHEILFFCFDSLGAFCDPEEEINKYNFSSIKPFAIKPEALKVGDKVEVLDIARECGNYAGFSAGKKGMVGKGPFLIKEVNDDCRGINYLIHNEEIGFSRFFPHYAVCLWTRDDEKTETIVIRGQKFNKKDIENLVSKKLKPINQ